MAAGAEASRAPTAKIYLRNRGVGPAQICEKSKGMYPGKTEGSATKSAIAGLGFA